MKKLDGTFAHLQLHHAPPTHYAHTYLPPHYTPAAHTPTHHTTHTLHTHLPPHRHVEAVEHVAATFFERMLICQRYASRSSRRTPFVTARRVDMRQTHAVVAQT